MLWPKHIYIDCGSRGYSHGYLRNDWGEHVIICNPLKRWKEENNVLFIMRHTGYRMSNNAKPRGANHQNESNDLCPVWYISFLTTEIYNMTTSSSHIVYFSWKKMKYIWYISFLTTEIYNMTFSSSHVVYFSC